MRIAPPAAGVPAIAIVLAVAGGAIPAGPAIAQGAYPSKPVRVIFPYPPGGGTDAVGRIATNALGELLGQQFVVDTRPGASGQIGTEIAAKSPADGYTLVLGNVAPIAILPASNPKLPYDPLRDLAPISLIATSDYILTVHPSLPVRNINDLIALAKKRPGELSFASSGALGGPHLAGELLNLLGGINVLHVPYKGNGPAVVAVLSGEATMLYGTGPAVVPFAQAGKMRIIATTGLKRTIKDVPALAEQLNDFQVTQWYGLLAPANVPREIIERLSKETARVVADPKNAAALVKLGTEPVSNSPAEFRRFIEGEIARYTKVVRAAKITAQ
jgi:tripartite-type tricarboxylate transporter receptor subunit TctC